MANNAWDKQTIAHRQKVRGAAFELTYSRLNAANNARDDHKRLNFRQARGRTHTHLDAADNA